MSEWVCKIVRQFLEISNIAMPLPARKDIDLLPLPMPATLINYQDICVVIAQSISLSIALQSENKL